MMYLTNNHDILSMIDTQYMHNISTMPVSQAVVDRMSWIPMIYEDKEWPDISEQMESIFGRPIYRLSPSVQIRLEIGDRLFIPIRQYDPDARDKLIITFTEVRIDV